MPDLYVKPQLDLDAYYGCMNLVTGLVTVQSLQPSDFLSVDWE